MRNLRQIAAGFTLTELVMVIVIASILAAFAAARISTTSFDTEGFANRAAAMVRYAQKVAISQRRTVFVVISASPANIKLCYANSGCGTPVPEPAGASVFSYNAPSGVSLSGSTFSFNALGKPSVGPVTITVTGDVARTITVEAETGYVH